jgi:hypothetical protein
MKYNILMKPQHRNIVKCIEKEIKKKFTANIKEIVFDLGNKQFTIERINGGGIVCRVVKDNEIIYQEGIGKKPKYLSKHIKKVI